MRCLLVALITYLTLHLGPGAFGNLFVVHDQGRAPTLWPPDEDEIVMASESVRITERERGEFHALCTFVLRSAAGRPLERTVAFPIVDVRGADFMAKHFQVTVDDKPVAAKLEMTPKPKTPRLILPSGVPPYRPLPHYPARLVWPMSWPARGTRTVVCTYPMGIPTVVTGLARGRRLRYVVRTGALWQAPIGEATISITFRADPRRWVRLDEGDAVFRTTYPKQARWRSKTEVAWHFTDWRPTEDIVVESLRWRGLGESWVTGFRLPEPYAGAERRYTEKTLDALAEREVEPWQAAFPKQVELLDYELLKTWIADILYHEILARHGDHFVVGRIDDEPKPRGWHGQTQDGYLVSKWHSRFAQYSLGRGWYHPDAAKTREAVLAELNDIEKANLTFLEGYDVVKKRLDAYRARVEAAWPGAGAHLTLLSGRRLYLSFMRYQRRQEVRDLTPLEGMKLHGICFDRCTNLADIGPLRGLPLTNLRLNGTRVRDLKPVTTMPRLELLMLRECREITDFTPLQGLKLKWLSVHDTRFGDLSLLADTPLETLDLTNCKAIVELAPLRGVPLRSLTLSGTSVRSLGPLKGMPLGELRLRGCAGVADLSPLRTGDTPPRLWILDLTDTQVSDLSPLRGAPLHHLLAAGSQVTDLSPLTGMPLERLIVDGCAGITDLSPLKGMRPWMLSLSGTSVADLSVLEDMPLTYLHLAGCRKIGDFGPVRRLSRHTKLTWLVLRDTAIRDLAFVHGLPLFVLDICGCEGITDLTPLQGVPLSGLWFDPHRIKKGIEVVLAIKSLTFIHPGGKQMHAKDFWPMTKAGSGDQRPPGSRTDGLRRAVTSEETQR